MEGVRLCVGLVTVFGGGLMVFVAVVVAKEERRVADCIVVFLEKVVGRHSRGKTAIH